MKVSVVLIGVALVGGCAHVPRSPPRWLETTTASARGDSSIEVRYTPPDEGAAEQVRAALRVAVPIAERWGALPRHVTITIHPTHEALEAAARRPGYGWLRAWARVDTIELQSTRTWSHGRATGEQITQLLVHELTHCATYLALGGDLRAARSVPSWFWEGMATTNAGQRFDAANARSAADGSLTPTMAALQVTAPPPIYPAADHAFRRLIERYGVQRIRQVLAATRDGTDFRGAFREVIGVDLEVFEEETMGALVAAHSREGHHG